MTKSNHGFFRQALDALIESRTRQAHHYVTGTLLMLDDETLKSHGYSRDELRKSKRFVSPF